MGILNVGQLNSTLKSGNIREWAENQGTNSNRGKGEVNDLTGPGTGPSQTFGDFLKNSIVEVNDIQTKANDSVQKLISGEEQDIHETMMLMEKAELAFKTMGQIRNKVIEAYREIMRMQI